MTPKSVNPYLEIGDWIRFIWIRKFSEKRQASFHIIIFIIKNFFGSLLPVVSINYRIW